MKIALGTGDFGRAKLRSHIFRVSSFLAAGPPKLVSSRRSRHLNYSRNRGHAALRRRKAIVVILTFNWLRILVLSYCSEQTYIVAKALKYTSSNDF